MLEIFKRLTSIAHNLQKALNSRLSSLRIRSMSATDFDSMAQHSVNEVVFVNRDGDVELWKGGTKL